MPFKFKSTTLEGVTLIEPHVFEDERGYFIKDYEKTIFANNGLPMDIIECNESKSKKGTIRGLHFQEKCSQGKLIRVIVGSVFDVAVDLRSNSKTFGKWEGFYLSAKNHNVLFIPKGFAHGFLALEDSVFSYKCTDKYAPEFDSGIRYDDKDINVKWPLELLGDSKLIFSEKDLKLQSFSEFIKNKKNIFTFDK